MPKYAIEVEKTIMKKFVSSIITITLLLSNQSFSFAEEKDIQLVFITTPTGMSEEVRGYAPDE